jgi:hypothetical protein
MANYIVRNLTVDLVEDRAHVCLSCEATGKPTMVSLDFPLHVAAAQGEGDLRAHARHKARLILGRALKAMEEEG